MIVGLGNPGRRYRDTLHNAGFLVVDRLAEEAGIRLARRGDVEAGAGLLEGEPVVLARPLSYMNASGEAVAPLLRSRRCTPEEMIVIHDDLDIEAGRVRLKKGGGTAGHRGLLSLLDSLGTAAFLRVRVGIGRPPAGVDAADYVLSPPGDMSREAFAAGIEGAAAAVRDILREGFDRAATRWNARGGRAS